MLTAQKLSPLEAACGVPFDGTAVSLPRVDTHPARALEDATLSALQGPGRAFVAYSGGRDSALVLAAATAAARHHGLPEPIPLTVRLPGVPSAQEDDWQERTVAHLGLDEWERVVVTNELDLLGPFATDFLARHGPYWPANAHFFAPLLRFVGGGSLLTGDGGDDLFAWWRWRRAADLMAGRARRRPRDLATIAVACGPSWVRRWAGARRIGTEAALPWLTPAAQTAYAGALARTAEVPRRWDRHLGWVAGRRAVTVATSTLELMARDAGARVVSPLLAPRFLGALATAGGTNGLGPRTATLRALFGDLLPGGVLTRRDKATFGKAFFGPASRSFAREWDERGFDPALVDGPTLRKTWLSERAHWQSSNLIHLCFLEQRA